MASPADPGSRLVDVGNDAAASKLVGTCETGESASNDCDGRRRSRRGNGGEKRRRRERRAGSGQELAALQAKRLACIGLASDEFADFLSGQTAGVAPGSDTEHAGHRSEDWGVRHVGLLQTSGV